MEAKVDLTNRIRPAQSGRLDRPSSSDSHREPGADIDPDDTVVFIGPQTEKSGWLEFRTAYGLSVVVERALEQGGSLAWLR
jgi:hypothetical protein